MPASVFLDTNILIHAFDTGTAKAEKAEALLAAGGAISVQVLNEFTNVSRKKLNLSWDEVAERLDVVRALTAPILPLDVAMHEKARALAAAHSFSFYDALVVAAAIQAKCAELLSEDMQDGRVIEGVRIRNPLNERPAG